MAVDEPSRGAASRLHHLSIKLSLLQRLSKEHDKILQPGQPGSLRYREELDPVKFGHRGNLLCQAGQRGEIGRQSYQDHDVLLCKCNR